MHAFISLRLDYCNALHSGLPKKSNSELQLSADKDQKAGVHYTSFKITALASHVFQDWF